MSTFPTLCWDDFLTGAYTGPCMPSHSLRVPIYICALISAKHCFLSVTSYLCFLKQNISTLSPRRKKLQILNLIVKRFNVNVPFRTRGSILLYSQQVDQCEGSVLIDQGMYCRRFSEEG